MRQGGAEQLHSYLNTQRRISLKRPQLKAVRYEYYRSRKRTTAAMPRRLLRLGLPHNEPAAFVDLYDAVGN
jgi:hypothetical protein